MREPMFFKDNFKKMKMPSGLTRPFLRSYPQTKLFYSNLNLFDDCPLKPLELPNETLTDLTALS
jgi:hypothetical protein